MSTVLVTARSTALTVTLAESVSFAESVSVSFDVATVAVFVIVDPADPVSIVPTIVSVSVVPVAIEPTDQVPPLYVPTVTAEDVIVNPAGTLSAMATPVAASGPLLTTVMVKVTVSPSFGVGTSTVFVTARSMLGTENTALSESFELSVSVSVTLPTDAVLVIVDPVVPASTVTTMVSVADDPLAIVPTVHVDPTNAPDVAELETSVTPAGSPSVIATPVAGLGPLFDAVTT